MISADVKADVKQQERTELVVVFFNFCLVAFGKSGSLLMT